MAHTMRLTEVVLAAGEGAALSAPSALYVAAGALTANGTRLGADEGGVFEAPTLEAGESGATVWCYSVQATGQDAPRGTLRLDAPLQDAAVEGERLLRLDSVAFPPGGTALLHTHQGPGIRCLLTGTIRIDTHGSSTAYGPGSPWFEAGPEPVFAQADAAIPTRFIRAMVLPVSLAGQSSIRYVNAEDRDRPKSQSYRGYGERVVHHALPR